MGKEAEIGGRRGDREKIDYRENRLFIVLYLLGIHEAT